MQLKSVQLFMDVVETGSFIAAAERSHTVQSNVTAHIKKLEDELGAQLFYRKGGARLTTAGNTFVTYARQMLNARDSVLEMFTQDKVAPSTLHLGAMETTTAVRLPPVLTHYHKQYPQVELTLETGTSSELLTKIIDGKLDGVFVAGEPEHSQLQCLKVYAEQLVLVGATPLKTMPSSEQFLESAFLTFRQGCSYRQRVELLLSHCNVSATRIFEFGSIDGIFGCVAAGMGYALMPKFLVESYAERFALDYLEIPSSVANIDTYFATGKESTWSPALTRFVAALG